VKLKSSRGIKSAEHNPFPLIDDAFVNCTKNSRTNQNITIHAENNRALSNSLEVLNKVGDNMQIFILFFFFISAEYEKECSEELIQERYRFTQN
jgi:hypothetical protein